MAMNKINAEMVRNMFLAGAMKLESQKEIINDLNVFPVPDGDTGTNMSLTIMSAAEELKKIEELNMQNIAKAISNGSLRGARGNSGVIFSQLCRGFSKEIEDCKEIDVHIIAKATQRAAETAYKAVMKPKEGTILTVAKGVAKAAAIAAKETNDIVVALESIIKHAQEVLDDTPNMLPVLKEAGVVDSGGQGLLCVLHGFLDALTGKVGKIEIKPLKANKTVKKSTENVDIKFCYCTEFIIKLEKEFTFKDELEFKEFLSSVGDSIVCVSLDDIVKIHVHTNHPGQVFEKGLTYGQLTNMKVDNMKEEHENNTLVTDDEIDEYKTAMDDDIKHLKEQQKMDEKEVAFVAISPGDGLSNIFKDMGADAIISGGQTMNPSTNDILQEVEKVNAKNIFILPNNGNIILAANQVKDLVEDKNIIVIPSKTIPQGIAATVSFDPTQDAETNKETMLEAIEYVKSGQVTYAVRDTQIDGKDVLKDSYIAITDDGLVSSTSSIEDTIFEMLDSIVSYESELISIYYGKDVSEEEAKRITKLIEEKYEELDVELQNGEQPVYYYIVSVE